MGQNARSRGGQHAWISVDVLLLTIAVVLTLFCIGAFIRIASEPQSVPQHDGLVTLNPGDELLAFEDFSFGADGWSEPTTSDEIGGLGPVLGPFGAQEVFRSFSIPDDTRNVEITFDVHLHGEWSVADILTVSLGEEEVIGLTIAGLSDNQVALDIDVAEQAGLDVHIEQTRINVRSTEPADPDDAILNLRMILSVLPEAASLMLSLAAQADGAASWTLDNLAVVARADNGEV